ncbi:hypothetical protein [Marinobacter sp.]|uniref:hypothetical protein n=1 Tax=Marinobacter sp. TaxID=50741 RepID=UPI003974891E
MGTMLSTGSKAVPETLSAYCASAESRYWLMDMIEISGQLCQDLENVAWVYFRLGESLNLS